MKINNTPLEKTALYYFSIFSWLYIFSVAFMNGDDVVHFAQNLRNIFLPILRESWIPNRALDMYGRTILSEFFNFTYYFVNSIHQIDFLILYKILSATFFSIFLTFIFWSSITALDLKATNKVLEYLLIFLIAILVLQIFFWRNQVHFICYQLPAWLTFVLLKLTYHSKKFTLSDTKFAFTVLLAYVCTFSIESSTLVIFIVSTALLFRESKNQLNNIFKDASKSQYLQILFVNIIFSFISMSIAFYFSGRINPPPMNWSNLINLSNQNIIYFIIFFIAIAILKYKKDLDDNIGFLLGLICANLFVVFIISIKSNTNYFDLISYPWGDLLLIGKIAVFFLLIATIKLLIVRNYAYQAVFSLIIFIIVSRLAFIVLDRIDIASQLAHKVSVVYTIIAVDKNDNFDTGLNLDNIPMGTRPFPTQSSPDWFKQSYQFVFEKYYGIKNLPTLR